MILGIVLRLHGGGPFSPGQLTAAGSQRASLSGFSAHADFEDDCGQCHEPWRGAPPERCLQCHNDVSEQRNGGFGFHGRLPDTGRCDQCHTEHLGREANITHYALNDFEHEWLTGYSLVKHTQNYDGAPLVCLDCHPQERFETDQVACVPCHQVADPIFVQDHSAVYGSACLDCHDGLDTMAAFDHQAVFPLELAHANLSCSACHLDADFRETSAECVACHQEPAIHAGAFGLDCARCHQPVAWTPALLSYHTFPLDHGDQGELDCEICHVQTYVEYTCYGCHEHQPAEIRSEHVEEGITDFADCAACHPTGHEAERDQSDG